MAKAQTLPNTTFSSDPQQRHIIYRWMRQEASLRPGGRLTRWPAWKAWKYSKKFIEAGRGAA